MDFPRLTVLENHKFSRTFQTDDPDFWSFLHREPSTFLELCGQRIQQISRAFLA